MNELIHDYIQVPYSLVKPDFHNVGSGNSWIFQRIEPHFLFFLFIPI